MWRSALSHAVWPAVELPDDWSSTENHGRQQKPSAPLARVLLARQGWKAERFQARLEVKAL
jgi:hypothetical protein